MPAPLRAVVLAVALAAPGLVACSAVTGADDVPELPDLPAAWEAEDVSPFVQSAEAPPALWGTDDLLVSIGGPVRANRIDVVGLDRDSGVAAWTTTVEGSLCSVSPDVTEAGLGAVLYRPTPDAECVGVAAVATTAGEVAWTTELEVPRVLGRDRQSIVPGVGVGETSVNVTAGCGRVTRLDPADGTPIETLGRLEEGSACSGPGGVGGRLVSYVDGRGRDARTVLLDTDRDGPDAVVWRRPAEGVVLDIPSTDPLLLDRSDGAERILRAPGPDGDTTDVGLRLSPYGVGGFTTTASADGVVAGRYYGDEEEVLAVDAASGDLLWSRPQIRYGPQRRLVGARDDELLWVQGYADPDAPGQDRTWVTTSDPRDPDSGRTLGSIESGFGGVGDLWTVEGDLLLNYSSSGTTAYDLTAADEQATDGVTEVPDGYLDDIDDDLPWAADDVRPADALGACRDVSPATLAELGLDTDLPAPVDCRWLEPTPGGRTGLDVTVEAYDPAADGTGAETASGLLLTEPPIGVTREVDLGDEATLTTAGGTGYGTSAEESTSTALLRVRRGNVLATVTLTSDGTPFRLAERPSLERLEALTAAVARDVLVGVGLDLAAPPSANEGPETTAPAGACAGSPALDRLAPRGEARPAPASSDGRVRVCERRPPGPYPEAWVGVSAEAVGPGLGTSAEDAAAARLDDLGGQDVDGPGDQAVLVEGDSFTDTRTLVVREGNLVIAVRSERSDDRDIRLADLRRVASDALGATRD